MRRLTARSLFELEKAMGEQSEKLVCKNGESQGNVSQPGSMVADIINRLRQQMDLNRKYSICFI